MAANDEIARYIAYLSNPDSAKRTSAAQSLNSTALNQCFASSNDWIRDPAFLELARPPKHPSFIVGVAVHPKTFHAIRAANSNPRLSDVPPDQDAMEFELHLGAGGNLDILTTRDPSGSGAIARYLAKFGEGIQQLEINVTDVDRATELLRTRFVLEPIYPATRAGADGTRVNFFLVPIANGKKFLVELVEPAVRG
jgi:hypothetical protein